VSVTEQTKFAYSKFALAMPSGHFATMQSIINDVSYINNVQYPQMFDMHASCSNTMNLAAMDEKNMTGAMFTITTRAYLGDSITGS